MDKQKLVSKKEKNGKEGIIKDENGYYKLTLGAFNTYNHGGIFYRLKDPFKLLNGKSILNRRITTGALRSEEEHPDYTGMNNLEIRNRTVKLDIKRVCAHIKSIEVVNTHRCEKGWDGYNIFIVYGWVKPTGPYGKYLQESLDNPDENVAFSIRSLIKQTVVGTTIVRDIVDISTWDHVYEPGISVANQWHAAGIEERGFDDMSICIDGMCKNDMKTIIQGTEGLTCEDGECLLNALNEMDTTPLIFKL